MKALQIAVVLLLVVLAVAGCSVQCGAPTSEESEAPVSARPSPPPAAPAEAGPKISSLETGDAYDAASSRITRQAAEFTPETKVIHIAARMSGLATGAKIKGVLTAVDVTDKEGNKIENQEVLSTEMAAPGTDSVAHFEFKAPTAGWPKGSYRIAILVNGTELGTADVTVK